MEGGRRGKRQGMEKYLSGMDGVGMYSYTKVMKNKMRLTKDWYCDHLTVYITNMPRL